MKQLLSRRAAPLTANMMLDAISVKIFDSHKALYGDDPNIASERIVQNAEDGYYFIETVDVVQTKRMRENYTRELSYAIRFLGSYNDENLNNVLDTAAHNLALWLRYVNPPSEILTYLDTETQEESEEIVNRRVVGHSMNFNKDGDNAVMSVYVTYNVDFLEYEEYVKMLTLETHEELKEG